jgi:hypothetical protein
MDAPKSERPQRPWKVKEFAEAADVTPNCVYGMIARNEIKVIRFGRIIRIPPREGDRLLKGEPA